MDFTKKDIINFEELILLYKSYLDYINDSVKKHFDKISTKNKKPYQFKGISYKTISDTKTEYYINYRDIYEKSDVSIPYTKSMILFDYVNPYDEKKYGSAFCMNEIDQYKTIKDGFSCEFSVNGKSFFVKLNIITNPNSNSLNNTYAIIKVTNKGTGEIEEFQYDYNEITLFKKVEDKVLIFPEEIKNQIINNLPIFRYKTLPKEIIKYIKYNDYYIDLTPKKEENEKQSFTDIVCNNSFNPTSEINNKESIKNILTKMKSSGIEPNNVKRIQITNNLFYIEITDNKKTIDPFFNDEEILKYCDLSKIDFTNADIRNFNLANTNASIVLHKVYNRDITNANLENINLFSQDLTGIKADGANLRGTFVIVTIDKTSIIGTKFDKSSVFFLGKYRLSHEEVESMGIELVSNSNQVQLAIK